MDELRRESDRKLHEQNATLLQELAAIKATLDVFVKTQDQHNQRIEKRLDGIDDRLRDTEKKTFLAAAVSGAIVSGAVALGFSFLHKGQ